MPQPVPKLVGATVDQCYEEQNTAKYYVFHKY